MKDYNLQDPTDVDIMRSEFDFITEDEWEGYIELATEKKLGFKNINALRSAQKKAGIAKYVSAKMIKWVLRLVDQLEQGEEDDARNEEAQDSIQGEGFKMPLAHLTLCVAWHDNKWNGSVCQDPANNTYCSGFHSLLSERIRNRKENSLEQEVANKGLPLGEIDYMPPCFWSINLFGDSPISVKHDNPAAPQLKEIQEELAPRSMLSWPFSVSYSRTQKEVSGSGTYPKNLETVRIPRFNAKIHKEKSIAFMYAKSSNPLTEEEQQYLVVGAGLVSGKQSAKEIRHFGPNTEIAKIRDDSNRNYKNRNFPSMNLAMRFSFEENSSVRMPYHEYLEEVEKLEDEAKEGFLDNIKVAITEPELAGCFKHVAMDIGDDEAIYILSKMRKSLLDCMDDGVVAKEEMQARLKKVEELLTFAWSSRSYFPGFVGLSRVLLEQQLEINFPFEKFYEDFKEACDTQEQNPDEWLTNILNRPKANPISEKYAQQIYDLTDKIEDQDWEIEDFLRLAMLNLFPFQFERVLDGKLKLHEGWIRDFDERVKRSHKTAEIIENPYLLSEDYEYWPESHDDVYGEEKDTPIDIFKIDIAYFPDTRFHNRLELQKSMEFSDKRRIRALVLRHLKTLEDQGHCFAEASKLQDVMKAYPLFYELGEEYPIQEDLFSQTKSDLVDHFEEEPAKLKVLEANDTTYYYLAKVYEAEKKIEEKLRALLEASDNEEKFPDLDTYLDDSIDTLLENIGEGFDKAAFTEERSKLYGNIFSKKLYVLSGSAGSGKSYELQNILSHLEQEEGQKYLLLAPTSKAALRLNAEADLPGIKASTIDKIVADFKNEKISRNQLKAYQNLVIEETSMLDLVTFAELLSIFNFKESSFKRLILVGDSHQLPAMGFGRVLTDLIEFLQTKKDYHQNYIELASNCRAELKGNAVVELAEGFKQKGELSPILLQKFKDREEEISEGFKTRYWSTKTELYGQILEEFNRLTDELRIKGKKEGRLNQLLGLSATGRISDNQAGMQNFQILSPFQGQFSGTNQLNDFIQSEFKKGKEYIDEGNVFKDLDKLIRTKDSYQKNKLQLSNGTLGLIKKRKYGSSFSYDSGKEMENIFFSDIRKTDREFFELAYAITVQQAQGSRFKHVFLVIPARFGSLSKELMYTALTRTQKSITLFLETKDEHKENVLEVAGEKPSSEKRATSLMREEPRR